MTSQDPTSSMKTRVGHAYTTNSKLGYLVWMSLSPKKLMAELKGVPYEGGIHNAGSSEDDSKGKNSKMIILVLILAGLGAYLLLGS